MIDGTVLVADRRPHNSHRSEQALTRAGCRSRDIQHDDPDSVGWAKAKAMWSSRMWSMPDGQRARDAAKDCKDRPAARDCDPRRRTRFMTAINEAAEAEAITL